MITGIVEAISTNTIGTIYITVSTDCLFANKVLREKNATDFYAELILMDLYRANMKEIDQLQAHEKQVDRLLNLHLDIQHAQLKELLESSGVRVDVKKLILSPKQLATKQHELHTSERVSFER